MIRIAAVWLAVEPLDLRIGMESALARVVGVFGAAQPHHACLFTNLRVHRIKVLVNDGFGLWLAVRRQRQPLPAHLPRREIRHETQSTICGCGCALKRIGEDVSEMPDYVPGVFSVERHVRGKWVCAQCETLI